MVKKKINIRMSVISVGSTIIKIIENYKNDYTYTTLLSTLVGKKQGRLLQHLLIFLVSCGYCRAMINLSTHTDAVHLTLILVKSMISKPNIHTGFRSHGEVDTE